MPATPNSNARLLIADDQRDVLEALRLLLKPEGFGIETAGSPSGVLDALAVREFEAVLIDLNYARDTTSGQEGLDLKRRTFRCKRADYGRTRKRKRSCSAHAVRAVQSGVASASGGEYRRFAGGHLRKRIVRPRAWRVHRC